MVGLDVFRQQGWMEGTSAQKTVIAEQSGDRWHSPKL